MNTQISTKLAALGVALVVNGAMIGSVAYLFSGQAHATAMVRVLTPTPALAMRQALTAAPTLAWSA
jgi:hypothetical protein